MGTTRLTVTESVQGRLTRRGIPWREADPPPVFSEPPVTLRLSLIFPFSRPIDLIQRLRAAGLTLGEAKRVVDRLTDGEIVDVAIPEGEAAVPGLLALGLDVPRC